MIPKSHDTVRINRIPKQISSKGIQTTQRKISRGFTPTCVKGEVITTGEVIRVVQHLKNKIKLRNANQ